MHKFIVFPQCCSIPNISFNVSLNQTFHLLKLLVMSLSSMHQRLVSSWCDITLRYDVKKFGIIFLKLLRCSHSIASQRALLKNLWDPIFNGCDTFGQGHPRISVINLSLSEIVLSRSFKMKLIAIVLVPLIYYILWRSISLVMYSIFIFYLHWSVLVL